MKREEKATSKTKDEDRITNSEFRNHSVPFVYSILDRPCGVLLMSESSSVLPPVYIHLATNVNPKIIIPTYVQRPVRLLRSGDFLSYAGSRYFLWNSQTKNAL